MTMQSSQQLWCKICGLTQQQDVIDTVHAGASAIGLNFYSGSPRYVEPLLAQRLSRAAANASTQCQRIGLFVDATEAQVGEVLAQVDLDMLQFSGDETAAFCRSFGKPFLKAVKMQQGINISAFEAEYADAWALLLDTHDPSQAGGTGQVFDWKLWPRSSNMRLIVAGGLGPENVASAVAQLSPFGVDVSSGVEEGRKGIKNSERVRRFIEEARHGGSN
jgi:phosphoribosylanthranilate isomerase